MADPRGAPRQFLGKSGKFVCWHAPPRGLAPPPTEIRPCNVLDGFSCFYIVIVYSDFTFCGAYMLSFLASHTVSTKPAHPVSGGSKGGARDVRPSRGVNSFNFMQFLGKFAKIVCWRPPGELAPLLGEILDPPLAVIAISPGTFQNDIVQDFPGQAYCYCLLGLIPQYFV